MMHCLKYRRVVIRTWHRQTINLSCFHVSWLLSAIDAPLSTHDNSLHASWSGSKQIVSDFSTPFFMLIHLIVATIFHPLKYWFDSRCIADVGGVIALCDINDHRPIILCHVIWSSTCDNGCIVLQLYHDNWTSVSLLSSCLFCHFYVAVGTEMLLC